MPFATFNIASGTINISPDSVAALYNRAATPDLTSIVLAVNDGESALAYNVKHPVAEVREMLAAAAAQSPLALILRRLSDGTDPIAVALCASIDNIPVRLV